MIKLAKTGRDAENTNSDKQCVPIQTSIFTCNSGFSRIGGKPAAYAYQELIECLNPVM